MSNDSKKPDKDFLNDLERKIKKPSPPNDPSEQRGGQGGPNRPDPSKKPGVPGTQSPWSRISLVMLIILGIFTFYTFSQNQDETNVVTIPYSEFIDDIQNQRIKEVLVIENQSLIEFEKDGIEYNTRIPYIDNNLLSILIGSGIVIKSEKREESKWLLILIQWLPWILIMVFFWFLISRQLRGRGGEAFNFGKSKAQMIRSDEIKERFTSVKGCNESVEELKDIVSFLRNPKKYSMIGAKIPKGVLLVGLPGTGKTLLARAVAGEANVPFFSISGSDFVEMFVGVGASRVRDLFENAKKNSPCIIFVDEIDAVGRSRGSGYGGGHDEREQTLNQLLVEMDGFETNLGIVVVAATNRADVLDKALLRPGRFDRQVVVDVPDVLGREEILQVHAKKIKIKKDVDLNAIARTTVGFTGADLENLINEAALLSAKQDQTEVTMEHLEIAKDKVMLGTEKKSRIINEEEKRNTAYHEAGHALVSLLIPKANQLHKVTIVPRGRALGITHFFPEDGKLTLTKKSLEAQLRVLYGGRAAEEIMFKDVSNGAMNDIERATQIAKAMVCEWGLSRLGAIFYGSRSTNPFSYDPYRENNIGDHSPEMGKKIDLEVKRILDEAYSDTLAMLRKNLDKLKKLAEELLVKETLGIEDIYSLLRIKPPKAKEIIKPNSAIVKDGSIKPATAKLSGN